MTKPFAEQEFAGCATREVKQRRRVNALLVREEKMDPTCAELEIALIEKIAEQFGDLAQRLGGANMKIEPIDRGFYILAQDGSDQEAKRCRVCAGYPEVLLLIRSPLKLWEIAILQGYAVFRQVRANNGGIVIGDRSTRTITYKPLNGENA